MPYLIDGHNLIGQLDDIHISDPNDEAKLVLKLRGFCAREKTRVIVIFDKGMPSGSSQLSNTTVEVRFAPYRSDADSLLIQRIEKIPDPTNWTVVSSDQRVLERAILKKMRILRSADFAKQLRSLLVPLDMASPPPQRRRPGEAYELEIDDPGAAVDIRLSAEELAYWMRVFPEPQPKPEPPPKPKKRKKH